METLENFYQITLYVLPAITIVMLVFLTFLIIRLLGSVKKLDEVLDKTKTTVDYVNLSLIEIQRPLNTLSKISNGIDLAYDYGEKAIRNFFDK